MYGPCVLLPAALSSAEVLYHECTDLRSRESRDPSRSWLTSDPSGTLQGQHGFYDSGDDITEWLPQCVWSDRSPVDLKHLGCPRVLELLALQVDPAGTHTQRHTHSLSRLSEWWLGYKAGLTSSRAPLLPSHRAILFFHPVPESKQTLNDSCVRQCDVRITLIISHIKDVLLHSDRTAEVTTCCWHRAQMKNITQHYNHHQCQSIFVLLSADHRWDLQRQSCLLLKLTRC